MKMGQGYSIKIRERRGRSKERTVVHGGLECKRGRSSEEESVEKVWEYELEWGVKLEW